MEYDTARLNPSVTAVPEYGTDDRSLALQDVAEKRKFVLSDDEAFELLAMATDWTPVSELLTYATREFDASEADAEEMIEKLVDGGFLVTSEADAERAWLDEGWDDAGYYYEYIRDYPFLDYGRGREAYRDDLKLMQEYKGDESIPDNYSTFEGCETLALPEPGDEFPDFSAGLPDSGAAETPDVDRGFLSTFLYFSFGQTGSVEFPVQGEFVRKTSPSGGARHPTEAYLVVRDVEGVPAGVYHYSVKEHELEVLDDESAWAGLRDHSRDVSRLSDPAFALVLTSRVERSMWRYREPRTYRIVQHDIGHLVETVRFLSRAWGLECASGHEHDDEFVHSLLDVPRFDEPLFRIVGIGEK